MKKIIVAIAILMLMHFAALGVLAALYPVNPLFDRTYDGRPEVECFEFRQEADLRDISVILPRSGKMVPGIIFTIKSMKNPIRHFL
jgi:hypothetical protein